MAQIVKSQPIDRLRIISVVLGVVGAVDSSYLTYIKLAHVAALCRGVGDCESVNSSSYSQINGIPIAILGLGAYMVILVLLALESRMPIVRDYGPLAVLGLALTGTLYSAYLTYVELFVIHAVCPYCVVSALMITGLLVLAVLRLPRGPRDSTIEP